jgi:hypothetical protein
MIARHHERGPDEVAWPDVHPPSQIGSWGAWPDDVRDTLLLWNKQRWRDAADGLMQWRLSFSMAACWPMSRPRVFKCWRCKLFHEQPRYGTAIFEGRAHCDGCMIELARAGNDYKAA